MSKPALYLWGLKEVLRLGWPDVALGFLGGLGDDLLCSSAIHEHLDRGAKRIWFITRYPQLYRFDRRVRLLAEDPRYTPLAARLKRPVRHVSYSTYNQETDRDSPPREHLIAEICRKAGLTGKIDLKPHLPLTDAELTNTAQWENVIALQTSSLNAAVPMANKQWATQGFQAVVDFCKTLRFKCVQIGSATDPVLSGIVDLRGKTNLRETAALLARSRLFIGLVGFLMHLARAVDCPSVIVYGGREPPDLTGYTCNINIVCQPSCSPCWQRNRCDRERECMTSISAEQVTAAVRTMLGQSRNPLRVDQAVL